MRKQISEEHSVATDHFLPPWYFRNGHIQTLAGLYLFSPRVKYQEAGAGHSMFCEVPLADGDCLVYRDDSPPGWKEGDRVALLLHGLGGSHTSPYLIRIARQLNSHNVRTMRLDWRGCGRGVALARYPYHSGRSEDLAATLNQIHLRCPGSPVSVIGFSLGGNVALKYAGESENSSIDVNIVDRVIAVCPPVDLKLTVTAMQQGWSRIYDRYFCRSCIRDVQLRQKARPDAALPSGWSPKTLRTLYDFDDAFTAPVCGYASADDYYSRSSANQFLKSITIPTLIIASQDDPLIPFSQFAGARYSANTTLLAPKHGGHLGFCTLAGQSWLDQKVVTWAVAGSTKSREAGDLIRRKSD